MRPYYGGGFKCRFALKIGYQRDKHLQWERWGEGTGDGRGRGMGKGERNENETYGRQFERSAHGDSKAEREQG